MTREEALNILHNSSVYHPDYLDALQMAIESLEQKSDAFWCEGCKEYDNEQHCCHRYTNFIRYSLNDNINAVLEDVKTEIKEMVTFENVDDLVNVTRIIDKHRGGEND